MAEGNLGRQPLQETSQSNAPYFKAFLIWKCKFSNRTWECFVVFLNTSKPLVLKESSWQCRQTALTRIRAATAGLTAWCGRRHLFVHAATSWAHISLPRHHGVTIRILPFNVLCFCINVGNICAERRQVSLRWCGIYLLSRLRLSHSLGGVFLFIFWCHHHMHKQQRYKQRKSTNKRDRDRERETEEEKGKAKMKKRWNDH